MQSQSLTRAEQLGPRTPRESVRCAVFCVALTLSSPAIGAAFLALVH